MVIAPSKKNTISLTSADACVSCETAISVEGAYKRKSNVNAPKIKVEIINKRVTKMFSTQIADASA